MQYSRRFDTRILITPTVVEECRRIPNSDTRVKVLHILAKDRWHRCMPEAYSESQELIREVRRIRPQWLRAKKDTKEAHRLKKDWTSRRVGFWARLKKDIPIATPQMEMIQKIELELARAEAYELRKRISTRPQQGEHTPLTEVYAIAPPGTSQYVGPIVEYWRVPTLYHMKLNLNEYANPYSEWVDGVVDLQRMFNDVESLNLFFLRDARSKNLSRLWLRSAFEFLQSWRRVTDGTPGDSQLSTHLSESDVVISADKNFISFANRCRLEGPASYARGILVPGEDIVEALLANISSL